MSGAATLSNASLIVDWGGFDPSPGTFVIMTFGSHIGTFADVTIPPVAGLEFTVGYTSTEVMLTAAVLPVELVRFIAAEKSGKIQLDWQTASESENARFDIERSADGRRWEMLDAVAGHGSTTEIHDYAYVDDKPLQGKNYYRLDQVDFDGRYQYSNVVCVTIADANIRVYPNPTDGILNIVGKWDANISYRVTDAAGNMVSEASLSDNQIDFSNLCPMEYTF